MYDVIYIDAHGAETPLAQRPRRPRRRVRLRTRGGRRARRGAGDAPGLDEPARLRLRRPLPSALLRRLTTTNVPAMRVGVIGGGLMGSGIAEVCARSGVDVTVVEVDEARVEQTRAKIDKSLDRAARSGKLEADDRAAAGERLAYTHAASRTSRAPTPRSRRSSRTSGSSATCSSSSTRCSPTPSSSPPTPRRCRS